MSDITLSDDFDTHITHPFTAETVLFMSSFVVPRRFVCSEQGAVRRGDTIALVCRPFLPSFMKKASRLTRL